MGRAPVRVPQPAGLASQEEERRLKGVLGRMNIAEQPPGDAEDHRPVPPDELRKGDLVAVVDEPGEQRGVGPFRGGGTTPANVTDDGNELVNSQVRGPPGGSPLPLSYCPEAPRRVQDFPSIHQNRRFPEQPN
jgi:hypothetical protein